MKAPVFALVDCQSFYCSCESVFEPRLWKIPLVVLSNNDGNVVALNEPAKLLGVPRGEAFFKVRPLVDAGKLVARSSNYTLYGDLSARTMATLGCFRPTETYSIDEAFLDLFEPYQAGIDLQERQLMETVDAVNTRYSQGSLRLGAQGIDQPWKTRA